MNLYSTQAPLETVFEYQEADDASSSESELSSLGRKTTDMPIGSETISDQPITSIEPLRSEDIDEQLVDENLIKSDPVINSSSDIESEYEDANPNYDDRNIASSFYTEEIDGTHGYTDALDERDSDGISGIIPDTEKVVIQPNEELNVSEPVIDSLNTPPKTLAQVLIECGMPQTERNIENRTTPAFNKTATDPIQHLNELGNHTERNVSSYQHSKDWGLTNTQPLATVRYTEGTFSAETPSEDQDELGGLIVRTNTMKKKNKRMSSASIASSIAALAPFIWGAKEEENKSCKEPVGTPRAVGNQPWDRSAQTTQAPYTSKFSRRQSTSQKFKDILNFNGTGSYKTNALSVAAQTVADWTTTLDSSFEKCLGSSSRFELEVPTISDQSFVDYTESTCRSTAATRFKVWRRKSRVFLSNWTTSATVSRPFESYTSSEQAYEPVLGPIKAFVDYSANAPSLCANTANTSLSSTDESVKTRKSRIWNLSKNAESVHTKAKISKRERMQRLLKSFTTQRA